MTATSESGSDSHEAYRPAGTTFGERFVDTAAKKPTAVTLDPGSGKARLGVPPAGAEARKLFEPPVTVFDNNGVPCETLGTITAANSMEHRMDVMDAHRDPTAMDRMLSDPTTQSFAVVRGQEGATRVIGVSSAELQAGTVSLGMDQEPRFSADVPQIGQTMSHQVGQQGKLEVSNIGNGTVELGVSLGMYPMANVATSAYQHR